MGLSLWKPRRDAVRAELVEALRVHFEYEGTSPIPRRYQSTKIDLRKFNLKGKGEVMSEVTRLSVSRVGVDLSKRVYHVHAVDRSGRKMLSKAMSPQAFYAWCEQLPPGCLVATEACGGAHHVARRLCAMGLDARMIAGDFVAPYRMAGKRGKNDANDAAAICEAAGRPHMRFVPVKTAQQQGLLAMHRMREGFKEERTALINRIRGVLAEFGLVYPKSPEALREVLATILEDASNELPDIARLVVHSAHKHWGDLDEQIARCDERIVGHVRSDERAKKAATLMGIGPVTASAVTASVADFKQFRDGRQFGAWLGLVPSQNSTGGKASLGRITKRGDDYLRTLLIQGAKSAVMTAGKRDDRISRWLLQLKERVGWQKAVVALANKNARILWAVITREVAFDPDHIPPTPKARTSPALQPAS